MAAIWSIEGIINVAGETLLSARHALAVSSIKPSNTWRRKWQPTPVFLPGKFHGQRSLVGSMESQRVRCDWATEHIED